MNNIYIYKHLYKYISIYIYIIIYIYYIYIVTLKYVWKSNILKNLYIYVLDDFWTNYAA